MTTRHDYKVKQQDGATRWNNKGQKQNNVAKRQQGAIVRWHNKMKEQGKVIRCDNEAMQQGVTTKQHDKAWNKA